ncbi:metallophosphoesterase [Pedobacter sp. GSP4]|uniref:metallophosphoesterase family protein n=1 Tax=Pedobacter sp. GSP4 TaxID=3453716 RepID=UPI003EED6A12
MNALNILHLSDLHVGNFKYPEASTLAITIANTLVDQGRKLDTILVSGDIFDGRSTKFEQDMDFALRFFDTLISQINDKDLADAPITRADIMIIPGNHDLLRSTGNPYEKYDNFISAFYSGITRPNVAILDQYNFICDFPERKIAILGFNSCRIEQEKIIDLDWIDKMDLSPLKNKADLVRDLIRENRKNEIKWDDFGYIDPMEMDRLFTAFKKQIPGHHEYNVVATFHHHFYPFPEISNSKPDSSFIRNYTNVLDQFQRHNIRIVLHGHKHTPIQRAVTDNKFFDNPESVIYVFAAGSIGCKGVDNRSFQWLRVYDRSYTRLAECERYTFTDEELQPPKTFILPPELKEDKSTCINLREILHLENPEYYKRFIDLTNDFEQLVQDSKIDKVIELVGEIFTVFAHIKLELRQHSKSNYLLLLSIYFRVIYLKSLYKKNENINKLLDRLKPEITRICDDEGYSKVLLRFLSSNDNKDIERGYNSIIKNVSGQQKRIGAFCSLGLFITDLFLNISEYGEFYFEKEKLNHKINISLPKEAFYDGIPSDSINMSGDIDRRAIVMNFKSKNPTVHKVAVLIIKDFEMRLDRFEESLKEIKLKLYYIAPKIQVDNYDLENFHFDAYIPTLLPLLTGDNLYKSKEVFIRELVQNSIDATLLREKMQPHESFDKDIHIELDSEKRIGGKSSKYFKIIDHGTGMSRFTIERYFTSIGRSYYVSEEFDELKKDNDIQYNAISNFGIGFLSSFMVCEEVLVETKSIHPDEDFSGIEIEIPNYDGCFFIRKKEKSEFGTEIKLYEDVRKLFKFQQFVDYMQKTLLGLPVNIHIKGNSIKIPIQIQNYAFQRAQLAAVQKSDHLIFYVPFSELKKEAYYLSYRELASTDIHELEKYGAWFDFNRVHLHHASYSKDQHITLNQGLLVSQPFIPFSNSKTEFTPTIKINYPSAFVQLDVSREKILKLNDNVDISNTQSFLEDQMVEFIDSADKKYLKSTIADIYIMAMMLKFNMENFYMNKIYKRTYTLKIVRGEELLHFSLIEISKIPNDFDAKNVCYLDTANISLKQKIDDFFLILKSDLSTSYLQNRQKERHKILSKNHKLDYIVNDILRIERDSYTSTIRTTKDGTTYITDNFPIENAELSYAMQLNKFKFADEDWFEDLILLSLVEHSKRWADEKKTNRGIPNMKNTMMVLKAGIFGQVKIGDAGFFQKSVRYKDMGITKQKSFFDGI